MSFHIWQLVPISLLPEALSLLFLQKLLAVGLSLAALFLAHLISMQPLWPQCQTAQPQLKRETEALENSLEIHWRLYQGKEEKVTSWQKGIIALGCFGGQLGKGKMESFKVRDSTGHTSRLEKCRIPCLWAPSAFWVFGHLSLMPTLRLPWRWFLTYSQNLLSRWALFPEAAMRKAQSRGSVATRLV